MRVASLLSASRSAWATPSVPASVVSASDAWASRREKPVSMEPRDCFGFRGENSDFWHFFFFNYYTDEAAHVTQHATQRHPMSSFITFLERV